MPTSNFLSDITAFNPKPPDTSAYDELSRGAVLQTLADRAAGRRSAATDAAGLTSMDRRVAGDIEITNLGNVAEMNRKAFAEGLVGPQTISDIGVTPEAVAEYSALKRGKQQTGVLSEAAQFGATTPLGAALNISGLTTNVAPEGLFQGANPLVAAARLQAEAQAERGEKVTTTVFYDSNNKRIDLPRMEEITKSYSSTFKGKFPSVEDMLTLPNPELEAKYGMIRFTKRDTNEVWLGIRNSDGTVTGLFRVGEEVDDSQ